MKKILITGGSGYQGVKLIRKLIKENYQIINIDNNLFGNYFIKHKNVKNFKLDINEVNKLNLTNVYACIHLASIANDPSVELNSKLSWEVNVLATQKLIENSVKFISNERVK